MFCSVVSVGETFCAIIVVDVDDTGVVLMKEMEGLSSGCCKEVCGESEFWLDGESEDVGFAMLSTSEALWMFFFSWEGAFPM